MKKEACPICESVRISSSLNVDPLCNLPLYLCGFCGEKFDIPIFIGTNEKIPQQKK